MVTPSRSPKSQSPGQSPSQSPQATGFSVLRQPAKESASKEQEETAKKLKKFMPYRTYLGKLDNFLGISMFWSEKLFILVMYLQRYALLLLWPNLNWPHMFRARIYPMYGVLLDFSAYNRDADPIGAGTIFEGCEVICKIVWPLLCLPILGVWACIGLHRTLELYYTRNIERIMWGLVRMGLLPFMNTLMRYFMLNQDGNIDTATTDIIGRWTTPVSETGVVLVLLTTFTFLYVSYRRSRHLILFDSKIRHEAWIRARELEYKLRFSAVYRNERVWMISSFTKSCWWWSFVRGGLDIFLLAIMTFVPAKIGIIIGCVFLACNFLYGFAFVDIHRCKSSNLMEHICNLAMFVFALFGCLRAYDVRNPLLVDSNLDWFLFGLHGLAVAAVLLLSIYFFIDSHKFGSGSTADKRAAEKWKRQFGKRKKDGTIAMGELAKSKSEKLEEEALVGEGEQDRYGEIKAEGDQEGDGNNGGGQNFYLPKEATFFSLNHASRHVWPINGVVINELLRRNQEDHLIDTLRAARKMLDRISALHNTAMLIPTDEMKLHINRLQKCVAKCQRDRITHHANAIHPLQSTFEDLIEQFSFELRVFSGRSITVGHNARKMINVSRYLRRRMLIRDHALALVSPLMRRVLIKLLALRMWIQLIEKDKDNYLLGPNRNGKKVKNDYEAFAEDLGADSDDDEYGGNTYAYGDGGDVFGGGGDEDLNVNVPLMDEGGEEDNFDFAAQLAKGLKNRGTTPQLEGPKSTSPQPGEEGSTTRSRTSSKASMGGFSGYNSQQSRAQSTTFDEPGSALTKKKAGKKKSVGFGLGLSVQEDDEEMESKKDQ